MKLRIPDQVYAVIKNLHPSIKKKIRSGVDSLLKNPSSGKNLQEKLEDLQSLPVGKYRIIYRHFGKIIEIIAIGPRSTIYEETYRLIKKDEKNDEPNH